MVCPSTFLHANVSFAVPLDVKLSVGLGGFQHEFVQLAYLLLLEVEEVLL